MACRLLEGSEPLSAEGFAEKARLNWLRATDAIISSRVAMVTQANRHRRSDSPEFTHAMRANSFLSSLVLFRLLWLILVHLIMN